MGLWSKAQPCTNCGGTHGKKLQCAGCGTIGCQMCIGGTGRGICKICKQVADRRPV